MNCAARLVTLVLLTALASYAETQNAGFSELKIDNGSNKPLIIGVWYPTSATAQSHPLGLFVQTVALDGPVAGRRLPLIVISHGTSGSYQAHYDTALALAKAGFVVATVSHTGDTFDDQSRAGHIMDRPQHIHRLIDYMLTEWPNRARIDASRVGMFGFSAGGFTTLVSIGGVPDFSLIPAHVQAHPDYFDSQLIKRTGATLEDAQTRPVHDSRIKAAVIAAPALGFTFGHEGLKDITVPIQLWRAEDDHILPTPDYADAVKVSLPRSAEFHLVRNADHFDFLAPCSDQLRQTVPEICTSRADFDRIVFHQALNHEVVRFFERTLQK